MVCCGCWSAAFSASRSALRWASTRAAIWISASRRAWRSVTACSTFCWSARSAVSLASSWSLICACSCSWRSRSDCWFFSWEVSVPSRLAMSLSVWLAWSRSCWRRAASTASVASTRASSDVPGCVYANTARWRAYSRSTCTLAFVVAIESCSFAMSARVCSSWWSAVENCAAVSLAAARASVSFCRAAARSSLVAAPAGVAVTAARTAGLAGQRQGERQHERDEAGGEDAAGRGHAGRRRRSAGCACSSGQRLSARGSGNASSGSPRLRAGIAVPGPDRPSRINHFER